MNVFFWGGGLVCWCGGQGDGGPILSAPGLDGDQEGHGAPEAGEPRDQAPTVSRSDKAVEKPDEQRSVRADGGGGLRGGGRTSSHKVVDGAAVFRGGG